MFIYYLIQPVFESAQNYFGKQNYFMTFAAPGWVSKYNPLSRHTSMPGFFCKKVTVSTPFTNGTTMQPL
jgi:hypothetical protein